ncbi:leucine-rich repeat-containing protein PRAME-like protein [Camelus ferus]|nr:leucine-rich repeat-containing protein PRAME-like protein [Camelus ferus]
MKMDQKPTATLLELAAKSLLSNEPAAIHALNEIPRDLFVPLFNAAFLGGHKQMLKAMSCIYSQRSILKIEEAQHNVRDLQIEKISAHKSILQFLDLGCIEHLDIDQAYLSEVTTLLARVINVSGLSLSNIPFKSYKGRNFRSFLIWLGQLDNLQEFSLSFFSLKDQLHRLLRVLPSQMDMLSLSYCDLSSRDVTVLSQSCQATYLRALNLSSNQIFSEADEPFQTLLEKVSGTLEHLEITNCMITDSTLSNVLPALSLCSNLRILSFAFNPITMPALKSLLQHLTHLMKLKYVIYPIPVHCYEEWNFRDTLDQQKLAKVQAQLNAMLQEVKRDDVNWTTFPE